jgi:arylsulfatase A-like enzyme
LPSTVPTLAAALKPLGYSTALFGKWHLGLADGSRPHDHGFDEWLGILAGCVDYFSHIFYAEANTGVPRANPLHDLWHNNEEIWDHNGTYLTELITEKAVAHIHQAARNKQPFFAYVAYTAPHYPMHAPIKYMARFPELPWDRQIMAAMISAMDDGVGEIMATLTREGLEENTIVFFMSDNGPSRETRNWLDGCQDPYYGGSAGKLKGHKFSLFEGGIRVPSIMSWPARIPAGQVVHEPAVTMDVFPTVLNAVGGDPSQYALDGWDLMPTIADGAQLPERDIYWEQREQLAVRRGPWKLVLNGVLVEHESPEHPVHLANLDVDMAERNNLVADYPELTLELTAAARAWRKGIDERWAQEWRPHLNGTTGHTTA